MSLATRVIARLDIKPGLGCIKPIRMDGLRVVGDPHALAVKYANDGADEILYLDVTASLYGRPMLCDLVTQTARDVDVPLTVGGGIRTLDDVRKVLRAGADKVVINTAAMARPAFITETAEAFGSQCVVVSIEAKRRALGWEAYTNNGRDRTGRHALDWIIEAVDRGAGEILLTSIDRDGTQLGPDADLNARASCAVGEIPLVVSGGVHTPQECVTAIEWLADAVAVGAALHFGTTSIPAIKAALATAGHEVRA